MSSSAVLWSLLRGDRALLDALAIAGPANVLPSVFDVTAFAASAVGVATLAAAELLHVRASAPIRPARVDTVEAAAAFRSEVLFEPVGWVQPPTWDPIAGDYRGADRWIRLHTNYASHRDAVLSVLGTPPERAAVEAAVARWDAVRLESAVVQAGGCAAAMYDRNEWKVHPHGLATLEQQPVTIADDGPCASPPGGALAARCDGNRPLEGIRVLDLTRVIAGPVCTRFLAAHGADVLRGDPPGFEEVGALLPETTAGKRCAWLALNTSDGAACFDALLERADVIVHGLRPGALERLGFNRERLRARNPALVIATLNAYGWTGPWSKRRGFDSLVQMSTGIAAARGTDRPGPLPAQALDHGIGYILAAGVCRALTIVAKERRLSTVRGALLGAANHLFSLPAPSADRLAEPPTWPDHVFEETTTAWGRARRVRCPGEIDGGLRPSLDRMAGPLGRDAASFRGRLQSR